MPMDRGLCCLGALRDLESKEAVLASSAASPAAGAGKNGGHGGGLVGQGRCEVGGKLSIDVEQATADLADQLAAVCCSPPRHHLPYYRGSAPERAP